MRNIVKGSEPSSLTEHRCQAHADYDNYSSDGKQELRKFLVEEQYGLCCYCSQRITADSDAMKIEHWQCQRRFPRRQLEYGNLLGACLGGEGEPFDEQHCDTRKGKRDLSRNPADPADNVNAFLRWLSNGKVESDDDPFKDELEKVLNLNHPTLVANRKSALYGFLDSLGKGKALGDPQWLRKFEEWNTPQGGVLREHCQVIVYYILKRLSGQRARV